jgi:putative tricarboxylic transport membrane protein
LGVYIPQTEIRPGPLILALIIGPLLEVSLRQSLMRSAGSFSIFWHSSITLTLFGVSSLLFLWNLITTLRPKSTWKKALDEG